MTPNPDCLRLSLDSDATLLAADVAALSDSDWIRHLATRNYDGDWDVEPLRATASATHPAMAIVSDAACHDDVDTPVFAAYPASRATPARFNCPPAAVGPTPLEPGSIVEEHRDPDLGFEDGAVRIHGPIVSSPDVDSRVNGTRVALEAGPAWYRSPSNPQSVANRGATDRVDIVIDGRVTPWIEALFADAMAEAA